MEAVASGLAAGAGLDKPGARVGVYGANCREWMLAMQVSPERAPAAARQRLPRNKSKRAGSAGASLR